LIQKSRIAPTTGVPELARPVSFFRAHDRALISGDVLVTIPINTIRNLLGCRRGLSTPHWCTT
jgi:hypothetical protein